MLDKLAVVAALVVVLLVPVSARAAEPLDLGAGHKPGVAVDQGDGTAYIAWIGTESPSLLHFCRLPRGASACDVSSTIPAPGNSLSRPYVASYKPANEVGHVAVVSSRYGLAEPDPNQVWQFVSATGQGFDAGHAIGYPAFDEAVEGPSLSTSTEWLFVATNAFGVEGMVFQAMPLEGGSAGAAHAVLSSDHPYHGSVGLHGDWNPIAVFSNGSSMAQFRRYDGSGDYNDVANWLPAVDIGYADYPRLASSYARAWSPAAHPNGIPLFLLAGTETGGLVAREWNGATFGPGATISESADDAQSYLVQDIGIYGGRLDAFYPKGSADGLQLFHATSPDGSSWQSEAALHRARGAVHLPGPRRHARVRRHRRRGVGARPGRRRKDPACWESGRRRRRPRRPRRRLPRRPRRRASTGRSPRSGSTASAGSRSPSTPRRG